MLKKIKVSTELADTSNASVSWDLVTEKCYKKKKPSDVSSVLHVVHDQSYCPYAGTAFYSESWIWRCKTRGILWCEHVLGTESVQAVERNKIWNILNQKLVMYERNFRRDFVKFEKILKSYLTLCSRCCETKGNF